MSAGFWSQKSFGDRSLILRFRKPQDHRSISKTPHAPKLEIPTTRVSAYAASIWTEIAGEEAVQFNGQSLPGEEVDSAKCTGSGVGFSTNDEGVEQERPALCKARFAGSTEPQSGLKRGPCSRTPTQRPTPFTSPVAG